MTTPTTDDFAMKVLAKTMAAYETAPLGSIMEPGNVFDGRRLAAARVLSEAFVKVRAEERARIAAWLQREAGKTHECYEHVFLDAADTLEQGAQGNG